MNLQLLPSNGSDLGPGSSEYSLAKSTFCNILVRTVVDFARQIAIFGFKNRFVNKDMLLYIER